MAFDKSYLESEVRDGFYIPSIMKQCWAAELEILREVDCLCRKYHIQYFAEWGTLLGAVRHGGFIPWDDDFDIMMKRDDYVRFWEVSKELPFGIETHNYQTKEEHTEFISFIVGKSRICFEEEHLNKYHGFPYICGLDIFIVDYISADVEEERKRDRDALFVLAVAEGIANGKIQKDAKEDNLKQVEEVSGEFVDRKLEGNQLRIRLYEIVERLMAKFPKETATEISQLMPWGLKNEKSRMPKEYYEKELRIPFEDTTIPVPSAYDNILKRRYGDYMKVVKGVGGHNYPFFREQEESLRKTFLNAGEDADKWLPEYRCEKKVLLKSKNQIGEEKKDLKERLEMKDTYKSVIREAVNTLKLYQHSDDRYIADAQQLAIDLGTMIEQVKGEGTATVKLLEEYCEAIYQLSEVDNTVQRNQMISFVGQILMDIETTVTEEILNKKIIVFLPFKADYWKQFEHTWAKSVQNANNEVYVIPIPYFYKDYTGILSDMQYSREMYPEKLYARSYEQMNLEFLHPDEIYIQYPYDQYDVATQILPEHYSFNLSKVTDKLIYVPWFETKEFTKETHTDYYNMKYYCQVPALVYANEVQLSKEWMKPLYVEKLTEWSGEETRDIWDSKIRIVKNESVRDSFELIKEHLPKEWLKCIYDAEGKKKKILLYYIGIGQMLEHRDKMFEKLQRSFEILLEKNDRICMLFVPDKTLDSEMQQFDESLWKRCREMIIDYCIKNKGIFDDSGDIKRAVKVCDAYYGDSGFAAHMCQSEGKLVMIQNVEI